MNIPSVTVEGSAPPPPQEEVRALPTEDGKSVVLIDPDGQMVDVPRENAARAIQEFQYRPATDQEEYTQRTGTAGTVAATLAGVGRGISYGTFDSLAIGAERALHGDAEAEEMRRTLRLLKEGHETASLIGEVGGSLAPMLLGAPPASAEVAGSSLLARATARAVQAAPGALLEGAAIGLGSQLSEDVLHNHELSAQKYVSAGLEGGALGVLLGASLHAGAGAIADKVAARKASDVIKHMAYEAGELQPHQKLELIPLSEIESRAPWSSGKIDSIAKELGEGKKIKPVRLMRGDDGAWTISDGIHRTAFAREAGMTHMPAIVDAGEVISRKAGGESAVGNRLANLAEEQAAKSILPSSTITAGELQRLGRTAEEQQGRLRSIGRTLLDEGIVTATSDVKKMSGKITERVAEVGEELGDLRRSFEKAKVRPSAETVATRIGEDVLKPMMDRPFAFADTAVVKPYVEELEKRLAGKTTFESFDELFKLRAGLDKRLEQMRVWEKVNGPAPGHQDLKAIRGILETEFERAADAAALELGENTAQKYRVAKALFSDLKTAEKWSSKAAARSAQNQAISLSDVVASSSGGFGGVAMGVANKLRRTYGNQAAALIADKGARIMGVQRAEEAFNRRLEKSVKGFYSGKGGKASSSPPDVDPETARRLRQAAKNPTALMAHVTKVVAASGLQEAAPRVAQGVASTLMRAGSYLAMHMPPEPPPAGFTFGKPKARALGPYAQAKQNAVIGALDVEGLLAEIESGRIDRQKVEALKFINPDLHADIVNAMVRHGQENQATLSHQQEVALSILTGQPIGAIMQPKTIKGFQQAHASQGPAPDPVAGGGAPKPIGSASGGGMSRAASALQSSTDRMEADNG